MGLMIYRPTFSFVSETITYGAKEVQVCEVSYLVELTPPFWRFDARVSFVKRAGFNSPQQSKKQQQLTSAFGFRKLWAH